MASGKQSFLQGHWDWLVALGGFAAAAAAAFFLMQSLGQTPEDAAAAYREAEIDTVTPLHKGVAPVDLAIFEDALRAARAPASLGRLDPKKPSFLASEARVFCQDKACGRPIPALAEKCPTCGAAQSVVKVEADADHDGMPNDWEKKYGFNPEDPSDARQDADGDGFTNLEEYKAGTNPREKTSHPDYLDFLSVSGNVQDTTLDFYFKVAQQLPAGYRFTFQRLAVRNKNAKRTYTAVLNGEIATDDLNPKFRERAGWKVVAYTPKQADRKIPGSQLTKKEDVSEVVIERLADGKRITLVVVPDPKRHADRIKTALESRIDLAWSRGDGKTFKGLSEGATFSLNERTYKVLKLRKTASGPEVTVLDQTTMKEKIIR